MEKWSSKRPQEEQTNSDQDDPKWTKKAAKGDLKLLRRSAHDGWYSASRQYGANCSAHACLPNSQPLDAGRGCAWQTYLFNVTADPTEAVNLADDARYASALGALDARVRELYEEEYYQPLDFVSQESIEANEAFYLAGGWVVPFGCAVVE